MSCPPLAVAADSLQFGRSQLADCARRGCCAQGACALDANNVIKLLTFDAVDTNRKAGHDATALNVHLPELVRDYAGGEYSLFFANCQARGPGLPALQLASRAGCRRPAGPRSLRSSAACVAQHDCRGSRERVVCFAPQQEVQGSKSLPWQVGKGLHGVSEVQLCGAAQPNAMVSFDLRVALYNVKASGRKDYLAIGEDMLPTVYMVRRDSWAADMSCAIATTFAADYPLSTQHPARAHDRQRSLRQLLCRLHTTEASRDCDGVLSGGCGVKSDDKRACRPLGTARLRGGRSGQLSGLHPACTCAEGGEPMRR